MIQVDFGGLANAVDALGGIYMYFPLPALDRYSSLDIHRTGCQLLNGFDALAVARSRHFYYLQNGQWLYDGTSDFGRIDRQNQFLRALIERAKSEATNLPAIASFLDAIPKGVAIDDTFGYNELLGLALKFHGFNPDADGRLHASGRTGLQLEPRRRPVRRPAGRPADAGQDLRAGRHRGRAHRADEPAAEHGVRRPRRRRPSRPRAPAATAHPGHHVTATTQPLHTEPWYTFNPVACTPGVKVVAR